MISTDEPKDTLDDDTAAPSPGIHWDTCQKMKEPHDVNQSSFSRQQQNWGKPAPKWRKNFPHQLKEGAYAKLQAQWLLFSQLVNYIEMDNRGMTDLAEARIRTCRRRDMPLEAIQEDLKVSFPGKGILSPSGFGF